MMAANHTVSEPSKKSNPSEPPADDGDNTLLSDEPTIELVVRAQRVATRSLTAYREGASALPAVLEARRTAREVLGQYIDDVAALLTVNTELRALTQTVSPAP